MKTAVINSKTFITDGYRIDPDIHLSDGVKVRRELNSLPYELSTIGENAERVFSGNIYSRVFVPKPEYGVEYLAASDTVLENINTRRYLSKKQVEKLKYLVLEKNWILITCSGTLGNVTYTNSSFEGKIATHDLIRVIPDNKQIKRGVIYAFLQSRYGFHQITQSQFGGVVKHINDEQTKNIVIPIFNSDFQCEIDSLIQEASTLREKADRSREDAIQKVSNYLDADISVTKGFVSKEVKVNSILETLNTRIDAPVFINEGVRSLLRLNKPYKKMGELSVEIWYPGIFKREYVKNGLPYIKGAALLDRNPFKNCDNLSKTRTPMLSQLWLKEGLLMMTCAGLCGDVKLITREYEEKHAIGSPDIIRIKSNDSLCTTEYLFAYLQTPVVYEYLQSMKYGSVIERFDAEHTKSIPIILPTKELSDEVTAIIKNYMDCTYKAFKAEEQAISLVEHEIERWNK